MLQLKPKVLKYKRFPSITQYCGLITGHCVVHQLCLAEERHSLNSCGPFQFGSGGELLCPICGRASSRRDNLERHIRSHLGDKPFKCPFCSFRSQLKWNMKSHIERRHSQTCATPSQQ